MCTPNSQTALPRLPPDVRRACNYWHRSALHLNYFDYRPLHYGVGLRLYNNKTGRRSGSHVETYIELVLRFVKKI